MSIATNDLMATLSSRMQADKARQDRLANAALSSPGPTTGPGALGGAQAQIAQRPVVGQISGTAGGSVGGWIQQAAKALHQNFSPQEVAALNLMIQRESSGNPNAVNRWDSNAKAGHPSQGLMQTIPSTFQQYALPGYNSNILDPVSNLIAGIRYAQSRYGNLLNVPGVRAVNAGGKYRGY